MINKFKNLNQKYNYLCLSDDEFNSLILHSINNPNEENIDEFIINVIKNIINNRNDNLPVFLNRLSRNTILNNYINMNINYQVNYLDCIFEISKLYFFYDMIESEEEISIINSMLLRENIKFLKIVENIFYNDSEYDNKYLKLIKEAYFNQICKSNDIGIQGFENLNILTKEEERILFLRAKNGDSLARNKFIECNLRLVFAIAHQYSKCAELDDLIGCGSIGLIKAYDKFDLDKNYKFSTYASYWIRKEINDFIEINRNIKIPHITYTMINQVEKAKRMLSSARMEVNLENISSITGFSQKEVEKLLKICMQTTSLDTYQEEEDCSLYDFVQGDDDTEETVLDKLDIEQIHLILKKIVEDKIVSSRDMKIFMYRNGFFSDRVYKYEEIGSMFGISEQRCSQIFKSVVNAIKRSKHVRILKEIYQTHKVKRKN